MRRAQKDVNATRRGFGPFCVCQAELSRRMSGSLGFFTLSQTAPEKMFFSVCNAGQMRVSDCRGLDEARETCTLLVEQGTRRSQLSTTFHKRVNMRRFALLFTLCACTVYSQTYYMNIRMKGGSSTSIPIQDIQKLTFSDISAVGNERFAAIIKTFTLLQNYPNPFNPTTTIEYQLPKSGNVEIRIFNLNGQLVRKLESTHQVPGTHTVVWDGRSIGGQTVASGLYIYEVAFENSMLAKKMLFIK